MERSKIALVMVLMVFFASTLEAAGETWGQWAWKWGTRTVTGVVAAGIAVTTLPVTGPVAVCVAVSAGSGAVGATALAQGDDEAAAASAKVAIGSAVAIYTVPAHPVRQADRGGFPGACCGRCDRCSGRQEGFRRENGR